MFSADWFFELDKKLREMGLDSDQQSFDDIRENLAHPKRLTPGAFAHTCAYVIMAGGFSQRTAKILHAKVMNVIRVNGTKNQDVLLKIFNNDKKISAICKIWDNRVEYCTGYYDCADLKSRLEFLQTLPYIGPITVNHLARNLGEDIVKYDIWIQRLGCVFSGNSTLALQINNKKLSRDIRRACDAMFEHLVKETGEPRGYIDVVLWKGLQQGLIKL